MSEYRWHLRVCAAERDRARAYVRRHQFEVGAPVQFDEQYDGITSLEYLLGAVGADIVNSLRAVARQRRVALDQVEALVSGELDNPLVFLAVVGESGHPGLSRIALKVYAGSPESEERIRKVWEEALARSPLANTFRQLLDISLEIVP